MPRTKKEIVPDNSIKCPNCGAKMPQSANYCGMCRQPLSEVAKAKEINRDIVDEVVFLIIKEKIKRIDEDVRMIKFLLEGLEKPELRKELKKTILNLAKESTLGD